MARKREDSFSDNIVLCGMGTEIFNALDDLLLLLAIPSGEIVEWNRAAELTLGLSEPGIKIGDVVSAGVCRIIEDHFVSGHRGERFFIGHNIQLRSEKENIYDLQLKILRGKDGTADMALLTARDVSSLSQLESELQKAEKWLETIESGYKTLTEQLPVGVYRTTTDGRILHGNPALSKILGHTIEALTSMPAADVFEDERKRKDQLKEWEESQGVVTDEFCFRTGDGRKIWVRDTGRAIFNEMGEVDYYDGIIEDITDRRLAEEALREERERLNTVLLSLGDGVIAIDVDFNAVVANQTASEYLEVLGDSLCKEGKICSLGGRPIEEFFNDPPEGKPCHEIRTKGKKSRIFEITTHIMDAGEQTLGWVLLLRDVTRDREVRLRVETQERLASMGQLAAGVAHDFNNVLLVMMSNAEYVKRSATLSERDRERLELISEAGEHAAGVIRQVLDFTRQSLGTRKIVDMAKIVRATTAMLRRTMPKEIDVSVTIEPGEYSMEADLAGMQQVLTNYVINARDAMAEGGTISVMLTTARFTSGEEVPHQDIGPGDWIVLRVSDLGEGIPQDVLPSIFEPFFTTKGPSKGAGLGLSQVYGIVKQHLGHIEVETEIDGGSTFITYLPVRCSTS